MHKTVTQRIECRACGLSYALTAAAQRTESRHADYGWSNERRVRGGHKVNVEFVEIQGIAAEIEHVVRRTDGRRRGAVQICRQYPSDRTILLEANLRRRLPSQHLVA